MSNNNERGAGTARVLLDQFTINEQEIEEAVVKGLTMEGFDVSIEPIFQQRGRDLRPMQVRSIVKVYKKMRGIV